MSDTIPRVISKGKGSSKFDGELASERKGTEGGGDGTRLKVKAEQRRGSVEGKVGIETAGKSDTGNTGERGHVPGQLGLVDAEMGSDGAAETLSGKDLISLRLGCGGSVVGGCGATGGGYVRFEPYLGLSGFDGIGYDGDGGNGKRSEKPTLSLNGPDESDANIPSLDSSSRAEDSRSWSSCKFASLTSVSFLEPQKLYP
jgi:hypothetical protein